MTTDLGKGGLGEAAFPLGPSGGAGSILTTCVEKTNCTIRNS